MVDQEGHLLFCRKISADPSQVLVDQFFCALLLSHHIFEQMKSLEHQRLDILGLNEGIS